MGDWNTLHHFDDKKFYSKIVTDFKSNGELIKKYFNSEFGKYIAYGNDKNDERIAEILRFSQDLDEDFKSHKTLLNIHTRKKGTSEEYSIFIKKRYQDEEDFQKANGQVIEDINLILTLMIFSECAAFNPHLILGRSIFTGRVNANPNSVAGEIIFNFTDSNLGSIFYSSRSNCTGLINLVTNEDLKLLWLDKENLYPTNEDAKKYFTDFCKFIEIAIENNLGVVSCTNMNESILKMIQSPLSLKIDLEALGLESVINYE
ncbi:hypothetical protein [Flavobacterium piscisymbiosum]|uniref:Uncharacterized protein n=1 Tax=Flavobacterium piscisymbiosum TaxID=2893753 RepID=A0ABS8MGN7_9FLAO|nr:hypothetical protein [Flavobacterium sp. F-30]MCC9064072.1 hypothetical protein [Flavobacterium sp. F-30]